jgi:hypothetical protein
VRAGWRDACRSPRDAATTCVDGTHAMNKLLPWTGQILLYALFAALIGVFSRWPTYQQLPSDQALIKLSFIHPGQLLEPCRKRTDEELSKLPPNMRAPMQCGRERSPVTIELELDGAPAYRQVAPPSGLSADGASAVYHVLPVAAGAHQITVRLNDSTASGFAFERSENLLLRPAQILVIDFDTTKGGILLQ